MFLKSAMYYRDKFGFSIIPVAPNKKALIKWQEYQSRKATDDELKEWDKAYPTANVGIVTGRVSDLAVVDIDEAKGFDEIGKYIPESLFFPVCKTPSGGQHWYFRMPEFDIRLNARVIPGCDLRAEGGYVVAPPSKTPSGLYQWLETSKIGVVDIPVLPDSYVSHVTTVTNVTGCHNSNYLSQPSHVVTSASQLVTGQKMFIPGRRDNDLFHTANCLVKGGMPPDEIHEILQILGSSCGFPENELRIKIQSALDRAAKRERNLLHEVEEYLSVTSGDISVTNCYIALQAVTKEEKAHIRQILHRKCGTILEKHPTKGGCYRVKDTDLETIDWMNVGGEEIALTLPMNVEHFVKIMPKNLIVIAGSPNSGKTAFLLNTVKYNMYKYNINYFSSEMSEMEFKTRLQCFEDIPLDKWRFNAFNRCSNFADVIRPDEINIIDFLELHDEFWKVGALFKEIYEKLTTGIAIIAIQKKRGASVGKGGDTTLEKPRLYLNMDSGRITIMKGKNWRGEMNPNGLSLNYKLVHGSKFVTDNQWDYVDANS